MNKSYYLLLQLILIFNFSNAQNAATPNPGFEFWTQVGNHYDPDNWNTLNPNTSILGVFTCTRATGADVHSGSYAIKLTTKSVFGVKANGISSTATLITTPPYGVTGGLPYTGRPDSIVGWYKYAPATSADSGFAEIVLFDSNGDTVGFARFTTPNTAITSYTRFAVPVSYFSTNATANSYWILTSSDGTNPVVNSSLFIDDLDLVFNTAALEHHYLNNQLLVFNNVANDILMIKNNSVEEALLIITDETGRIVNSYKVNSGENNFSLHSLAHGVYFYRLSFTSQNGFVSGKLIRY